MTIIRKLWNHHFTAKDMLPQAAMWAIIIVTALVYPVMEVGFKMGNPGVSFGIQDIVPFMQGQISSEAPALVRQWFPAIWLVTLLSCVLFRAYFIVASYVKGIEMFGRQRFVRDLTVYLLSVLVTVGASILFFSVLGIFSWLSNGDFQSGFSIVKALVEGLRSWVDIHIPTLVELPYPIALLTVFLGFGITSLGGYFVHWLTHQSRFLWLTVHRPHHIPEIMHPVGNPLAYNFDFLLIIPNIIFNVFLTKLVHHQPLLLESTLVLIFYYNFEIFNHSTPYYHLSYQNKFFRFFCDITGSGAYHYMHHNSMPGKETVNLGGGFFMLWDRLFGTFEQPPTSVPSVGLTHNPDVYMNPFRITFSGFAQIWFELQQNKNWKTRFLILFGGVYYIPPITKEYLILGYPNGKK